MHKSQSQTKFDRKARQLLSEEKLREKNAKNPAIRERAEKAECNRLALIAKNPVVTCTINEGLGHFPVRIPFAALPKQCQMAAVVAVMSRKS